MKKNYRQRAVDFLKSHEGFRDTIYYDKDNKKKIGTPTIGYGFTGKHLEEFLSTSRSKEDGAKILEKLVGEYEDRYSKNLPNWDKLSDSQKAFFLVFGHQRPFFYDTKRKEDRAIVDALRNEDFDSIPDLLTYGINDPHIGKGMRNRYRDMKELYFDKKIMPYKNIEPSKRSIDDYYRNQHRNMYKDINSLHPQYIPINEASIPFSLPSNPQNNSTTDTPNYQMPNSAFMDIINNTRKLFNPSNIPVPTPANVSKFAGGGLMEFNNGGTHEENPYGGIPVLSSPNSNTKMVEEGETKFDNFIFSDRIVPISEEVLSKYKIPTKYLGKTYAQISKDIVKEGKERPNDPLYKKYTEYILNNLKQSQEESKQIEEAEIQNQYANMYAEGGYLQVPKLQKPSPIYVDSKYDPLLDPDFKLLDTPLPEANDPDYANKVLSEIARMYKDSHSTPTPSVNNNTNNNTISVNNRQVAKPIPKTPVTKNQTTPITTQKQDPNLDNEYLNILMNSPVLGYFDEGTNGVILEEIKEKYGTSRDSVLRGIKEYEDRYRESIERDYGNANSLPTDSTVTPIDSTRIDSIAQNTPDTIQTNKTPLERISESIGSDDFSKEAGEESNGFWGDFWDKSKGVLGILAYLGGSKAINRGIVRRNNRLQRHQRGMSTFRRGVDSAYEFIDPSIQYRRGKRLNSETRAKVDFRHPYTDASVNDKLQRRLAELKPTKEEIDKINEGLARLQQNVPNHHRNQAIANFFKKKLGVLDYEKYSKGGELIPRFDYSSGINYGNQNRRIREFLALPSLSYTPISNSPMSSIEIPWINQDIGPIYGKGHPKNTVNNRTTESNDSSNTNTGSKGNPSLGWDNAYLRFAPAVGAGIQFLGDIFGQNKPDYSDAIRIENMASNAPYASFTPITERMHYTPFDREYHANKLHNQANATRGAILRSSSGNPSVAHSGLLASDYNAQSQLGQLYRQAEEYNNNLRDKATQFNAGIEQVNRQGDMQAQSANMQRHNAIVQAYIQSAAMRQREAALASQARSNNFTNFATSIGNIGREAYNRNMVNSMIDRYGIDAVGKIMHFLKTNS